MVCHVVQYAELLCCSSKRDDQPPVCQKCRVVPVVAGATSAAGVIPSHFGFLSFSLYLKVINNIYIGVGKVWIKFINQLLELLNSED